MTEILRWSPLARVVSEQKNMSTGVWQATALTGLTRPCKVSQQRNMAFFFGRYINDSLAEWYTPCNLVICIVLYPIGPTFESLL